MPALCSDSRNIASFEMNPNTGLRFGGAVRVFIGGCPVLVLRDLDRDAPCAPALVTTLLPQKNPQMLLRICVTSAESWLMADREAYAEFCGYRLAHIPQNPETVPNLKQLIQTLGENGTAAQLRRHFDKFKPSRVPMWGMLGDWHTQFAGTRWDPVRAADSGRAPSLGRALERLRELASQSVSPGGTNGNDKVTC
ncbi:hypothetical protein SAMN05444169_1797 [Bradyrhizobium erythrophlei]|jgi:hypothetical protein|uniref:Uncharacterized protein n=1 Tax=Bradyrhizobium erythrophlei TaxID=1437360 RepID=A0A1M5ITV1_9BRAD|nr:hypothetical protein SAMN05444169_1797 [Bradyrhizobium erythrophlei]